MAVTKAFDLTFSVGMIAQHTTSIGGEGLARLEAITKVACDTKVKDGRETATDFFCRRAGVGDFTRKQRFNPNDPALSMLEVSLLVGEQQMTRAADGACAGHGPAAGVPLPVKRTHNAFYGHRNP
ncbi:MAG: hypothetical protein WCH44_07130, partial [Betaproteobacteria bacterium]